MKIKKRDQARLITLEETTREKGQSAGKRKEYNNKDVSQRGREVARHLAFKDDEGIPHIF